jgi:hypothetical protein
MLDYERKKKVFVGSNYSHNKQRLFLCVTLTHWSNNGDKQFSSRGWTSVILGLNFVDVCGA